MNERRRLRRWGWRLALVELLFLLPLGCKTPPPNLKPPPAPQEYNVPPHQARYDDAKWPPECLADPNPKLFNKDKDDAFAKQGGGGGGGSPGFGQGVGGFNPTGYSR